MKDKRLPRILDTVRFYKYFFSLFMAICMFALPAVTPRSKFMESGLLDILIRFIIWLYFVFAYQSLSVALTNQIKGVKNHSFEMHRNLSTFMSFSISSIGLGVMIWFLTRWSLHNFVPWLLKGVVSFIAVLNGSIYTVFAFLRYFWLIESK